MKLSQIPIKPEFRGKNNAKSITQGNRGIRES
jgi:hypothetical protein